MAKEMLINVSEGEECRIALLDDGKLEELYMERTSSTSHVGNIYKGRVTNVEPSIQAAFVDFGLGRNGFLHISDLMPTYFGRAGSDIQESVGRKMARRDRPPIQRCLRRGDEIIVQIIKEGIGTKGPTLSTYLSIPGRILVMMPGMGKMGVSKKIEDEEERRRLRTILDGLKPPKGVGFIIRTAGIGKSKAEIQRDLVYLSRLWMQIEKKRTSGSGPMELYTEGDLVTRTVRDVFSTDVDKIVVDNAAVAKRVKDVIKITAPRTRNKVDVYEEPIPLFHKYDIEQDIELMYSRHVPLPSGGSLVIDSTEAIVAIDVNSGKFRDHSDAEMTAFKTDMEAAEEIPRQLKLRDLGGVIICDFIDLRYERHRRELEEKLHENFKKDRAKTKVLRMSQFGIIEITRQRMRPSLKRSIYFDCPHCKGAGLVKTPESMSLDVMRRLAIAANHEKVERIELSVCPDIAFYLLNKKRATLATLEGTTKKKIIVRTDQTLGLDETKLELFDQRDGLVLIDSLSSSQPPHTTQLGTRPHGGGRGRNDRRGGRGQQQGRHQPQPAQRRGPEQEDDRFELEDTEEAAEERDRHREPADPALVAKIAPTIVRDVSDEPAHHDAVDDADDDAGDADVDIEDAEEEESSVVDVDDGHSALGERPAGEWDRPQRDRGGRDRGGQNRGRDNRGGGQREGGQRGGPREGGRRDQGPRDGGQRQGSGQRDQGQRDQGPRDQSPRDQMPREGAPALVGSDVGGSGGGSGGGRRRRRRGRRGRGGQGGQGGGQAPQGQQPGGNQQSRYPQQPPRQPDVPAAAAMANYNDDESDETLAHDDADVPGPGNERSPGEWQAGQPVGEPGAQGAAGAAGEEGGQKRRRRRRGGRRHRRRRERERLEQQQGGALAPVAGGSAPHPDDEAFGDEQGDEHGSEERGDEERRPVGEVRDDTGFERDEEIDEPRHEVGSVSPAALEPAVVDEPEVIEAEVAEEEVEPEPVAEEPAPAKKKSARARKPAAKKTPTRTPPKSTKTKSAAKPVAKKSSGRSSSRSAAKSTPKAPTASYSDDAPVVKTGSADKHLVNDEPVDPQPARRPRARHDLDEIPDDFD